MIVIKLKSSKMPKREFIDILCESLKGNKAFKENDIMISDACGDDVEIILGNDMLENDLVELIVESFSILVGK